MRSRRPLPAIRHSLLAVLGCAAAFSAAAETLSNAAYRITPDADASLSVNAPGLAAPVTLLPEFTVLVSKTDPKCRRVAGHRDYFSTPRVAVRWQNPADPLDAVNARFAAPDFIAATGCKITVLPKGKKSRVWEIRDAKTGALKSTITRSPDVLETALPFTVGQKTVLRASSATFSGNTLRWRFPPQPDFTLDAELTLPPGDADPAITWTLVPKTAAWFSVALTGAPDIPLKNAVPVPQEAAHRGFKLFNYVVTETDLRLPRVHAAAPNLNIALAADPSECAFRLPLFSDSRFGLMLASENGRLRPVLLAPLLGGFQSKLKPGQPSRFTLRLLVRPGDWKDTYARVAQNIHRLHDRRDNTGPGSLTAALHRVADFLSDRNGLNHALWDNQQKYYDYFTDKTGVFKPFSPLYGLSAAIVTDDPRFLSTRGIPALEFALSRPFNVFAPYDTHDNQQANSAVRAVGSPYPDSTQLLSLHQLLQKRSPVLAALAAGKLNRETADTPPPNETALPAPPPNAPLDRHITHFQLTRSPAALAAAQAAAAKLRSKPAYAEKDLHDLVNLALLLPSVPNALREQLRDAAYDLSTKLNLYPSAPDTTLDADTGGRAPVHPHSFGRHRNQWGFPPPVPLEIPARKNVPAWRLDRVGTQSPAYPMEYWMNLSAPLLRAGTLTNDTFLRVLARNAMIGRFGNYPGDNRSIPSLVQEQPAAVENRPWNWNFATVNPGHAWDFIAQLLDFLVSDINDRSGGAIDFPALSASNSGFPARIYGALPGKFAGDTGVRLWLPRDLLRSDNPQIDWLAAWGNGHLYLALLNQSAAPQTVTLDLNETLARLLPSPAPRLWQFPKTPARSAAPAMERGNLSPLPSAPAAPVMECGNLSPLSDGAARRPATAQTLTFTLPGKTLLALAHPAETRPRLQTALYADKPPLPESSHAVLDHPTGKIHAFLTNAEKPRAHLYTEALPENTLAARLHWRQRPAGQPAANTPFNTLTDTLYPYEFTVEPGNETDPVELALEIETAAGVRHMSPVITLHQVPETSPQTLPPDAPAPSPSSLYPPDAPRLPAPPGNPPPPLDNPDFLAYLRDAANPHHYGLRPDNRHYPYSAPEGRRIAHRQLLWDNAAYASGVTRAEADAQHLAALLQTRAALAARLASEHAADFDKLPRQRQEILLDLAHAPPLGGLTPDTLRLVLDGDIAALIRTHAYVRYQSHVPDHFRNKAFIARHAPQ